MPSATATDMDAMRAAATDAAALLRLMSNEDRLLLLCQLSQGECCVGALEALLDIRQPTLSQQLGVLRNEGVVATRREGKHIYYRVSDERVLQLLQLLYDMFCSPAPRSRRHR
ncbi:ArsR/SmtB family transcription factor [Caldimonas thermodepolymerans]|jgi:Predicted transcriptional regulators|uniref:ArsR family transcriptional regulator n=1 Tax=Caldimonas thermodepolymerans TaxID=215580 RepID=A0AA46DEZ0_9BURK|nr:metalloregulator ArsR/SmtB family transcription factor [Caldimonas thermodepolymerans]TCP08271.1 ArsR family transcriptional regulator [Caldimonas thermodepolymerans]UZG48616.1 metalloregulator ArsR/SmtB family transcription factor [Caldimonas thermodepolymerans]